MTALVPGGGWGRWTVALCKPDATCRGLVDTVLEHIAAHAHLVHRRTVVVDEEQILTHYADMLALDDRFPFDVAAELRRNWVGQPVTVALFRGPTGDTPQRIRALLGHYDPAQAALGTIRGRYGTDSTTRARAEGRFIDNLIHTSDDPTGTEREFGVWFGPAYAHLLTPTPRSKEPSP